MLMGKNRIKSMMMFALIECKQCKRINNYEIANKWWHIGMILAINWDEIDVSLYVETDVPRPSAEDCWREDFYYDLYNIEVEGVVASIPMPLLNEELKITFERNVTTYIERRPHPHPQPHIEEDGRRNAQKETFHRFIRWMDPSDRYDAMKLASFRNPPNN